MSNERPWASPNRTTPRNTNPFRRPGSFDIQEIPPVYHGNDSPNGSISHPAPPYRVKRDSAGSISSASTTSTSDKYTSVPVARRITRITEEGLGRSDGGRDPRDTEGPFDPPPGVLANLLRLYGSASEDGPPQVLRRRSSSIASSTYSYDMDNNRTLTMARSASAASAAQSIVDSDDPRITGVGKNRLDDEKWLAGKSWERTKSYWGADVNEKEREKRKDQAIVEHEIMSLLDRQSFILKLAKALMFFGAPSHRLESQLAATARVLSVPAQFIHYPGLVLATFSDGTSGATETHIVTSKTRLMLGRLHEVHKVYRSVVHAEVGVTEGTLQLKAILRSKPIYSLSVRCVIAFCSAGIICPLAFGGSIMDALVAGLAGAFLAYLQLHAVKQSIMFSNVFEITIAMFVAFVARGLSSWQPEWFCYSAISTGGVVLILPGYAVLCSALELASKHIVAGSARLVWAISYTLFLGFSLTMGSDLFFVLDPSARHRRQLAASSLTNIIQMNGTLLPDANSSSIYQALTDSLGEQLDGVWTFTNQTRTVSHQYKYQIVGCYREPSWPWYRQAFPFWSIFILVPLYSISSSSWNLQPLRSKQMPVMVAISCLSYAGRKVLQHFIGARNEVVSASGAFVVGILGNVYARVFKATAFTSMVTGVLFLVPSGIAAAGGLAQNYRGSDGDQYTSTIAIGIRMLQVAIGTTVGLLASGLVVYSFGSRKKTALFAF